MMVALLSDIHGNAPALRAVLADLAGRADATLFLGDVAGYYPFVEECVGMLRAEGAIGVRGNHDEELDQRFRGRHDPTYDDRFGPGLTRALDGLSDESRNWISNLPQTREVLYDDRRLFLCHGAPWDPLNGRVYPDFADWKRLVVPGMDYVLLGHTHHPLDRSVEALRVLNPGSVGQPRDHGAAAAYGILNLERATFEMRRVPYDATRVLEDARRHAPDHPYLTEVLQRP